jgi:hypothetical protein
MNCVYLVDLQRVQRADHRGDVDPVAQLHKGVPRDVRRNLQHSRDVRSQGNLGAFKSTEAATYLHARCQQNDARGRRQHQVARRVAHIHQRVHLPAGHGVHGAEAGHRHIVDCVQTVS